MSVDTRRWRAAIARRLPVSLMEFPFECLTSLVAALMGIALLTGSVRPDSLFTLWPTALVGTYAVSALLGAATTYVGILRRNVFMAAIGLRLVSVLLLVYGVALIGVAGWEKAGFAAAFFITKALTGFLRAFYLRTEGEARIALSRRREVGKWTA